MVQSALLPPIDNPSVGRTLSAKPKVQAEQSESQHSESFARHLEKSREQSEANLEKPAGKLVKRNKPEQALATANQPNNRDTQIAEEKSQATELTASTHPDDKKIDQAEQLVNPSDIPAETLVNLEVKPVQTEVTTPDDSVVLDESVQTLLGDEAKDKPLELVLGDGQSDAQILEGEVEPTLITSAPVITEDPQTGPLLAAEVNPLATAKTTTEISTTPTLDAEVDKISLAAKGGTELPLDTASESDSPETDLPDIEMSDDLLVKGDDKTSKAEQFKLMMSQLNPADQKSQDKPTSPLLNPATPHLQQAANELAPASRLFVPQTQLGMHAANPNWGKAMGEKIMWMANQQLSSADIRLDPPELGSLQVKISIQQDQTTVTFVSPHPQVRELLDQQVTRLREMFAEQGLQLGQVNVADKQEQQSQQFEDQPKSRGGFAGEETEEVQVTAVSSLYLVDQFV